MIKDSGQRTEYASGAVRDMSFGKGRFDLLPWRAVWEVAKHCEEGARKYGERNVDKGIPIHSFIDSAFRHLVKYTLGMDDEPHLRAAAWNILWAMQTEIEHPELQDIPVWMEKSNPITLVTIDEKSKLPEDLEKHLQELAEKEWKARDATLFEEYLLEHDEDGKWSKWLKNDEAPTPKLNGYDEATGAVKEEPPRHTNILKDPEFVERVVRDYESMNEELYEKLRESGLVGHTLAHKVDGKFVLKDPPHKPTNADYIRSRTDKELAHYICSQGWRLGEEKDCEEWLNSVCGEKFAQND